MAKSIIEKKKYKLPDGRVLKFEDEKYNDFLFKPSLLGLNQKGMPEVLLEMFNKCEEELKKEIVGRIVYENPNPHYLALNEKATKKFQENNQFSKSKIVSSYYDYKDWIGGQIFMSSQHHLQLLISKSEYEEFGHQIVHSRCFL